MKMTSQHGAAGRAAPKPLSAGGLSVAVLCVILHSACEVEQCPPSTYEENGLCLRKLDASTAAAPPAISGSSEAPCSDAGTCRATSDRAQEGMGKLPDGSSCDDADDCVSGQCSAGICCASGDCCKQPRDCPDAYSADPACTSPRTCQGTRKVATCDEGVCSSMTMPDDSGCTAATVAATCPGQPPITCTGEPDQGRPPVCPVNTPPASGTAGMGSDMMGGSGATMNGGASNMGSGSQSENMSGGEEPKKTANGSSCSSSSDCESGHCAGGVCCASGQCCTSDAQCPSGGLPLCDVSTCSGSRPVSRCIENRCQSTGREDYPAACAGKSHKCGAYADVMCSAGGGPVQCGTTCTDDGSSSPGCAPGNVCRGGLCGPGCHRDSECPSDSICYLFKCLRRCSSDADCPGMESGVCIGGGCGNVVTRF